MRGLLLERAVSTSPSKLGGLDQTVKDFNDRRDLLRVAIQARLSTAGVDVDDFHVEAQGASSQRLVVRTDLPDRVTVTPEELHKQIGNALLAIGDVNLELSFMNDLNAVGILDEIYHPIVEKKIEAVAADAGAASQQLTRLLAIAGLPDLRKAYRSGDLNINKFLDACASDEAKEFRAWVRNADTLTDEQLKKMLHPLRIKAQSWQAKATMIAIGTAVPGLLGALEPAASIGLALAETFVLDKLLSTTGPAVFLRRGIGKGVDHARISAQAASATSAT